MAEPARQLPPDTEALEILRRIEPILARLEGELREVKSDARRQGEAIAELRGRVSQLPTIWQMVSAFCAINAGMLALGFGLAKLLAK